MRQRPKQASYVQKMDNQRQVSAAPRQTSAPSAPAKREGRNVAAADSGGKMTKFMNIDSIPDGIPTSPHGHDDFKAEHMPARHIAPPVVDELELPVQQESYYSMYANDVGSVRLAAPPGHRCSSEVVTALRSSPILVPNSIDEDDDWDHSDDVSEYRSPALKIGAAKNFVGGNGAEHQTGSSAGGAAAAERCSKQLEHRSNAPPGKDGLYYSKNPRKVEYRPYTLEQYKSIKPDGYVEYGKLKPDLNTDELKAKRANADRIKEFSKNLNSFNKQQIRSSIADSRDYGDGPEKTAVKSAREKALDFSKNVPKPKVRPAGALEIASTKHADSNNGYGTAAEEYCISADDNLIQYGMFDGIGENSRLQELQMKHGENKKKVDAIKKSLGISSNH